jgi:choline dehydrogenase-like flavoprotein
MDGGLMTESYDVIIGSRPGGEMRAQTLAGSGKSILLLERGDPGPVPARAAS